MTAKSKFDKGLEVVINSGRFKGFDGVVVDHFTATSKDSGKVEAGVTVENTSGEQRDAFDSRIKLL
ncbi:hypothetical protein [Paenibacillus pini]|uniref:Uncharacterized protein n=1 Tax=Paenibacillus pini JCM 16418 TaxID=1236976 RepID=W7Z1Q5_9BACL|nr:hypothetical protein [Paenibacillus pini]GAF10906.1 hypothetical protein JCM16418_5140 [Paenibacillus pini JCM 16418]